jgi:SAM-dependent MidA family methyltransferase
VSEYLLKYFPYEDFTIYEIGAGNGTLAMDILNYLQEYYPMVYERTRYNIIEISSSLVRQQKKRLYGVHPCAKVHHQSIFHWKKREPAPCYFVAMEVVVRTTALSPPYCPHPMFRTILHTTLSATIFAPWNHTKAL